MRQIFIFFFIFCASFSMRAQAHEYLNEEPLPIVQEAETDEAPTIVNADCGYKADSKFHCGDSCGFKADGKFHCSDDDSSCGFKGDGKFHCGSDCGFKGDGKFHCGGNCGFKADGNFWCEGD